MFITNSLIRNLIFSLSIVACIRNGLLYTLSTHFRFVCLTEKRENSMGAKLLLLMMLRDIKSSSLMQIVNHH